VNLRVYITELNQFKELYYIDEEVIKTQQLKIDNLNNIISNKDNELKETQSAIVSSIKLNKELSEKINKYEKRRTKVPYYIGAGFLGGIVTCLLLK